MSEENIDFWDEVTLNNEKISLEERKRFCDYLIRKIITSPEYAKLFFNTQVYNEIVNDVTTRGLHSDGVAIVAQTIAQEKAIIEGKSALEAEISGLLAKALGYMHDMGHTPFGHDGEDALSLEMNRFEANSDYKRKRRELYGVEYEKHYIMDERMSYSHNETSATIGSQLVKKFAEENGYILSEKAIQYIRTGILAHSTSRVKNEPNGEEQKAVRFADKIAYIPQDLLDLLKQSVITIDDLSPEEHGLLGLNEKQLTKIEKEMIILLLNNQQSEENESIQKILNKGQLTEEDIEILGNISEDIKEYLKMREEEKKGLKEQLRHINDEPEEIRLRFFKQLDVKVSEIQVEIGQKCIQITEEQIIKINGMKSKIDYYRDFINKGKVEINHTLTSLEAEGIEKFRALRDAQMGRRKAGIDENDNIVYELIPKEEQKKAIDDTAKIFTEFLIDKYQMDPMLATLWVTKSKYQDSFINGELKRSFKDLEGNIQEETLSEINKRNENAWKIKTTFQFFYTYFNLIPKDFLEKYKGIYTEEQLVAAFIASFTNQGLEELYEKLVFKGLIVSIEDVIKELSEKKPYIPIRKIIKEYSPNSQNANKKSEIPENDILELVYEEYIKKPIVMGKANFNKLKGENPENKRPIPPVSKAIGIRSILDWVIDEKQLNIEEKPNLLVSAIKQSESEIDFDEIEKAIGDVRKKQDELINGHIDTVSMLGDR